MRGTGKRAGQLAVDDLLALPGVLGVGISREMVGAAAFPASAPVAVPKQAWWLDAIQTGTGAALRAVDYIWGVPAVGELAEGVLYPGAANLVEDATHAILAKMKVTSARAAAQRTQVGVRRAAAVDRAAPAAPAAARLVQQLPATGAPAQVYQYPQSADHESIA